MISISHDTQTPKLGSSFCSNYTRLKQRSKSSLLLPCIQLFICLASTLSFSCCFGAAAKGAAALCSMPQSSQLFKSVSMTPSHNFQMVYRSQGFGSRVASGVAFMGRDQGFPFARHSSKQLHYRSITGQS